MKYSILNVVAGMAICALTFSLVSCDENKEEIPGPDVPDNTPVNTFTYDGKTFDIKSVVRNEASSVVEFYLSADQDLTTIDEILSSEDHVVLKADIKREGSTDSFTKAGSLIGYNDLKFETGDKGMAYIKFSYSSENEVSLDFKAETLYDGDEAAGGISGTYTGGFSDHLRLESVVLSADSDEMSEDETVKVTAVCDPEGYMPENLEWSIALDTETDVVFAQDPEDAYSYILSCEGEVSEGSVTVSVRDRFSDLAAEYTVNMVVKTPGPVEPDPDDPEVDFDEIQLNEVLLYKKVGDEAVRLTASCYYKGEKVESDKITLEWSSSDETVATVDQEGNVSFVSAGTATINVVKPSNRVISAKCIVNVSKADVLVTSIQLSPNSRTLKPGDYFTLSYTVSPEDAVDKELTFTSDNSEIATVAIVDGEVVVTAVAVGETQIRASARQAVGICSVEVTEDGNSSGEKIPVTSVQLKAKGDVSELPQFETLQIIPYYSPNGASPTASRWFSSDESIATVDENGLVTAVAAEVGDDGKRVSITHMADNATASINLTIVRAVPKSVVITDYPEGQKIYIGESFTFKADIIPAEAPQDVMWECYRDGSLIFNGIGAYNGLFTADGNKISVGTYTISVSSYDYGNIKTSMNIEVLPIGLESASLSETSLDMQVGDQSTLYVTFNPSNATYKNVSWSSSDPDVASVSGGKITALAEGNAVITASVNGGAFVLTCNVTVRQASSGPKVGDYFYSDGTYSTSLDQSKKVVGVVFYINNATLQDPVLKRDYPECTNGLVLGLDEWSGVWSSFLEKISNWATVNGYNTLVAYENVNYKPVVSENGKILHGYNNSKAIINYPYEGELEDIRLTDYLPEGAAVSGTSCWYVPSVGDLLEISKNYSLINDNIVKAGGVSMDEKEYWSSSEGQTTSSTGAITVSTGASNGSVHKQSERYIRHIFAF